MAFSKTTLLCQVPFKHLPCRSSHLTFGMSQTSPIPSSPSQVIRSLLEQQMAHTLQGFTSVTARRQLVITVLCQSPCYAEDNEISSRGRLAATSAELSHTPHLLESISSPLWCYLPLNLNRDMSFKCHVVHKIFKGAEVLWAEGAPGAGTRARTGAAAAPLT